MIRKEGNRWVLYSKDGSKVLGAHGTRDAAMEQEMAIHVAQNQPKK